MIFRMKGREHHPLILSIRNNSCPNVTATTFSAKDAKSAKYGNGLRGVSTAALTNVKDAQDKRVWSVDNPVYPVHPC